eukprot:COSAG03_NODE_20249_length_322_cov_0.919283_1_plen_31_part_01
MARTEMPSPFQPPPPPAFLTTQAEDAGRERS